MTEHSHPGNIYDLFAKQMFGKVFVFADFLIHYADPRFVEEIDIEKIKAAPTHYIGKFGDERIVDLVFQCPLKKGEGTLTAVIVFEHQSGSLKLIPRKLLKYISAIWEAEAKEGKKLLSAPYFMVLRTAPKPHRGAYPKMSDSLPKRDDGSPIGHVPEITYDVVDLPACDFEKLTGGPALRLAMGILKKMVEGTDESWPEALLPLGEIDEGQQFELTRDIVNFVDKAMAAHNKRLEAEEYNKAFNPVLKGKAKKMIKSMLEERDEIAEARGEAKGQVKSILTVLRTRFEKVNSKLEKEVSKISDPVVLDSLLVLSASCKTLEEFEKALK